jgi:hypothetical protein
MKITHTLKFPSGREYEMHYMTFEMSTEDLHNLNIDLQQLTCNDMWRLMQYTVQKQGLIFAASIGYIGIEKFTSDLDSLKKLFFDEALMKKVPTNVF